MVGYKSPAQIDRTFFGCYYDAIPSLRVCEVVILESFRRFSDYFLDDVEMK